MHTKQITIDSNTLEKSGRTVKDMISYLSQFPDDSELVVCFNDGADTHGVEIESYIVHTVPMTDQEIKDASIKRTKKFIEDYKKNIDYYLSKNQEYRIKETKLDEKLAFQENLLKNLIGHS